MRIEAAAVRKRRLSLTSLIDVIFLLLLFFMLSSTFGRFASVELAASRSASTAPALSQPVLLSMKGEVWRLNGEPMTEEKVLARLRDLPAQDAAVLLLAGDGTTSQQLVRVLERLRTIDGLAISVAR